MIYEKNFNIFFHKTTKTKIMKSIQQKLLVLLWALNCVVGLNAQQINFEGDIKADVDAFVAKFRGWTLNFRYMDAMRPAPIKSIIKDIDKYRVEDLGQFWYDAQFIKAVDTTYSAPDAEYFFVGSQGTLYGTSFPMFQLSGDKVNIDVKVGYKQLCGKQDMSLTFNMIGDGTKVIKAETIALPRGDEWTEKEYSLSLPRGTSLEVALEVAAKDSMFTLLSLAPIVVSSDGEPLARSVDETKYAQIPPSAIQHYDALLASPIMDKKILALGETIHGTQTMNDLAFSLIKERIEHHNCKLVLFELPLEETLYLNRYVKNDERYTLDFILRRFESRIFNFVPFLNGSKVTMPLTTTKLLCLASTPISPTSARLSICMTSWIA